MRYGRALACGTAFAALLIAQSGYGQTRQDGDPARDAVEATDETPGDVLVVGVRGSVEKAAEKKRKAKQIVDSVVAEDVGKLPDNNVPEAIARIPGVQITRARGQGQDVAIRGLGGVQTTINGNNVNLGVDRSIALSDVPAELLKAVDVYKTRTPDQAEGSIAGTVNIELRRPLDLKKGWTLAGSARGSWDEVAKKTSPFLSILASNRFDVGDGEMGVMINASWTKIFYKESFIDSESPDLVCCGTPAAPTANTALARLPANLRSIIVPYRAQYGLEEGSVRRPSINAVLQWAPTPQLRFVLEGQYIGSKELRQVDRLYALMREPGLTLSNVSLQPDGRTVNKLDVAGVPDRVPVGIDSLYRRIKSDLYLINFETRWETGPATLNAGVQYSWSETNEYVVEHLTRPYGLTTATIDFLSPIYKGGVPTIKLNGVDLSNPANYGVERFQDLSGISDNKEIAANADLLLKTSEDKLLRSLQFGARYTRRAPDRAYGYRDGFPRTGQLNRIDGVDYSVYTPLTQFPGGDQATQTSSPIGGVTPWYRIPGPVVLDRIADVLAYIRARDPSTVRQAQFASPLPPLDQGQNYNSRENTFAFYGMANYGLDAGIPIDGIVGARIVNTWGRSGGFSYVRNAAGEPTISPAFGRGNFIDILPSATARLHFTDKLQLRLAYSTNVQRVSFYELRNFYDVTPSAAIPTVSAGNPNLKAQRDQAFDASLEYYFGRGGQISFAGYYKKATDFLLFQVVPVDDLGEFGLPGRSGNVRRMTNAGDGTFKGLEATVQTFFDFLPGKLRNFGASLNASHLLEARVEYPIPEAFPGAYDSINTSKWTANAALYYDSDKFSARVAYNYRSPFRMIVWTGRPAYSWYQDTTQRLDAAVNYTPVTWLTLSVEGGNLLGQDAYSYFGQERLLPRGVRVQSRTVQASARFRF